MTHKIDMFYSFRSPYSYLAMGRMRDIHETYDCEVTVRHVYPIAVRNPDVLFVKGQENKVRYIILDSLREAERLGITYIWPQPDPVNQDLETFKVHEDQSRIKKLMRLGILAKRAGKSVEFTDELTRLLFSGTIGWDKDEHLIPVFEKCELEYHTLLEQIVTQKEDIEKEIDGNHTALEKAGHWGVPTMVYEGQPFFGQDRIDTLLWAMEKNGLKRRA